MGVLAVARRTQSSAKFRRDTLTLKPTRTLYRPGGGIGRRVGLKHQCLHGRAGSTPALGTKISLEREDRDPRVSKLIFP